MAAAAAAAAIGRRASVGPRRRRVVLLRGVRGRHRRADVVHVLGVRPQAKAGRQCGPGRVGPAGRDGLRLRRQRGGCRRRGGGGGGGEAVAGAGDARRHRPGGAAVVDVEAAAVHQREQETEHEHPGQAAAEPAGAQGPPPQGGVGGHAVEEGHHPRGEVQDPRGAGDGARRPRRPRRRGRRRQLPPVQLLPARVAVELVRHVPAAAARRPRLARVGFLTAREYVCVCTRRQRGEGCYYARVM